jgi:serine/threonine-protein kinase HipA
MERIARILFKGQPAGQLIETERGTRFDYDAGWQQDIACALPATRREHEWPVGLHPVFEHLGTEGWLREGQARVARLAIEDDFGLLLRYGADCIGAISIAAETGEGRSDAVVDPTVNPGRTVSGVQRKLLVVRGATGFLPAPAEGAAPFIAKFNSDANPTFVRNELLSLRWTATVLGRDEVTAFEAGAVGGVEDHALIVHRFDRDAGGRRLRLEDCAQILSKPQGRDHRGKYEASYEDVAGAIARHSARPVIDLARFFRRLVVYALIGNCDAHLKNFSLLERPEGLRLSPAYDVLNTLVYGDRFDGEFALALGGRRRQTGEIARADFETFGREIGLPAPAIRQTFADLKRGVANAAPLIRPPQGEPPDGFVHRFSEIVESQCLRLLG